MRSCIYIILNKVNNNFYLGSTIDYVKRFSRHKKELKGNYHHSVPLQRAWNKYGESNFEFIIWELCTKDQIKIVEQKYLDKLNPEYNTSKSAFCPMMGRKHSLKSRQKMSDSSPRLSGKNHHLFGKKQTKEWIKNSINSRKGLKRSQETRKKMSETNKKLNRFKDLLPFIESIKVKIIDSNGIIFNSMTECAKYHKISPSTVCDILKGRHSKTRKKISFKYYD